eukprot:3096777-Karenia_brevis.AAC.1
MSFREAMNMPCHHHIDLYCEIIEPHESHLTPNEIFSSLSDQSQESVNKKYEIVNAAAIMYLQQNGAIIPPKARR